jgi:hypothetical protein
MFRKRRDRTQVPSAAANIAAAQLLCSLLRLQLLLSDVVEVAATTKLPAGDFLLSIWHIILAEVAYES